MLLCYLSNNIFLYLENMGGQFGEAAVEAAAAFTSDGKDYAQMDAEGDEEAEMEDDAKEAKETGGGQAMDKDELAAGFKTKVHVALKGPTKKT